MWKKNIKLIKKNKTLIFLTLIQLALKIVFFIRIYRIKKLYLYYLKYYFINLALKVTYFVGDAPSKLKWKPPPTVLDAWLGWSSLRLFD
jgi:hypothetical protein